MLYWFLLWREFKLSIAEILAVFPRKSVIFSWKKILILDWLNKKEILQKADNLWGTIKIFELALKTDKQEIFKKILNFAKNKDRKFNYWFNLFPENQEKIKKYLIEIKRFLQKNWISSRYVNKNDKNLSSAQIIWNSLLKKWVDFNLIDLDWIFYFWKTIWVQNIDEYSSRDYSKSRDMQTGMLPPKLAQIMINLANSKKILKQVQDDENTYYYSIYDPFIGLWTILIEAKRMWFEWLYWSDLNEKMVKLARENVLKAESKYNKNFVIKIEKLNAKFVNEVSFWDEVKNWNIVTEWYLWEIMTQKNISFDRIKKQRESLQKIYEWFFSSLKKWSFLGDIVISFPFWDLKWKYVFFEEVYEIISKYCEVQPLFPKDFNFSETKQWSLLYKRQKQLVGREIFKLKIKKEAF